MSKTVADSRDRRRLVSPWFKRQIAARAVIAGLIVLVAASFAFGAVGLGIGTGVLAGLAVWVFVHRRRRWSKVARLPDAMD
jgi:O-antigen/teichoic acid export membrane protein